MEELEFRTKSGELERAIASLIHQHVMDMNPGTMGDYMSKTHELLYVTTQNIAYNAVQLSTGLGMSAWKASVGK